MQQPEQWGLLVTMLSQSRSSGGRKWAPFSLPSIAGPPAASRGRIGGLRRRWTRRWPRRRVAPSPGRAAAERGRNPGSSPGARPGSAARLPPGPGAPLGPSARRAPAGPRPGLQPARTAGSLRAPGVPGETEKPVGPFQNWTPCVRMNGRWVSNPGIRC